MEIARDLRRWAMVSVDFDAKADKEMRKGEEVAKKDKETMKKLEGDKKERKKVRIKIDENEEV